MLGKKTFYEIYKTSKNNYQQKYLKEKLKSLPITRNTRII